MVLPTGRACALVLAIGVTLLAALAGQSQRQKAGKDPYTEGDAEAIAKLGYVSLGPFPFGTGHTSTTIEELLGTEPLIWIETAHFRIGCALSPLKLRGQQDWSKEWIKKVQAELDVLRPKLPKGKLKKRVKMLDPWLRAHLMAQRLEHLYAEVLEVIDRDDTWFAQGPRDPRFPKDFVGLGPFMGMKEKFTVLMLQKGASHARYTRQYRGREIDQPIRHHDQQFGSIYWGCTEETANNLYKSDYALHSNLVFNVAHNLYTCYRCFGHDLPAWLVTGLAHWHSRRVSPRFPVYDRKDDRDRKDRSPFWDWDARVAGLIKHDVFEPLDKLVGHETAGSFGIEQHMQAWAVVDYLMANHPKELAKFLCELKDPFHGRLRSPSKEELAKRQTDAFAAAFGSEVTAVDAAWRKDAGKRKPKRKRRR